MRTYRLQVRVIQLSILLTVIVMIVGLFNGWQGKTKAQPVVVNNAGNTDTSQNSDFVTEGGGNPINTKIVCLGDSFTYGYPGQTKDSWPEVMKGILKIDIVNAGKVYQNTSDLLERFDQDVVLKKPGRVIIFAGVGDALRGKTLEEYQKNIQKIVEKANSNNIEPILALPIPFPQTAALYDQYRKWEVSYAQEKKITTLDFRGVLFDANGTILKKYSGDGRYPNKDGYQAMGEYAAGVLK